ncbi:MAG: DUF2933 domain-containing protein [Actinomycetota bacterium]|nr:DUF2933 domain-containing protein [Actinomycetota bacterium]
MNHSNQLRIAIAIVAGIAVAGLFGVPVGRFAPFALILLACPLMMFLMMRSMGHGGASHPDDRTPADKPVDR